MFKYKKVHLKLQYVADWTKTETVGVSSGLWEVFIINQIKAHWARRLWGSWQPVVN